MMKMHTRLAALLCAGAMALSAPACAVGYTDAVPGDAIVNADVSVYTAPAADAQAAAAVKAGDTVKVLSVKDGWAEIEQNGATGWLEPGSVTSCLYWTADNMAWVVSEKPTEAVKLYKRAAENANAISEYYHGTIVARLGAAENGYVKVQIGSSTGYMLESDLSATAVEAPPTSLIAPLTGAEVVSAPRVNAAVVGNIACNTQITVLGVRADGWAHVLVDGAVGFTKNSHLTPTPVFADTFVGLDPDGFQLVAAANESEAVVCSPNAADLLNLRKSPSATAKSLGEYFNGTVVTLLEAPDNGWVKVSVANGQAIGYMQVDYLAMQPQQVVVCHEKMVINNTTGKGLNLRDKSSTDAKTHGLRYNGETVTVIGYCSNGWCHVVAEDGQTGFMQAARLSEAE